MKVPLIFSGGPPLFIFGGGVLTGGAWEDEVLAWEEEVEPFDDDVEALDELVLAF